VFEPSRLATLIERLLAAVEECEGVSVVSPKLNCLTNTLSFVVPGSDSISLLAALDLEGICASSGSACSSGSLEPSHVVSALGFPQEAANSLVRFSLGRDSTFDEVEFVADALPGILHRVQPGQQPSGKL
jgi:cysteine desulfurase